jgi:hypothetical protein
MSTPSALSCLTNSRKAVANTVGELTAAVKELTEALTKGFPTVTTELAAYYYAAAA